jgi:PAS domain S-box-containing protein
LFLGSTRKKLVLLVLITALPALTAVFYSGMERREAGTRAAEQEVRIILDNYADSLGRMAASARSLLRTLAMAPGVRGLDRAACAEMFAAILADNPLYANIFLLDPAGNTLASALPAKTARFADFRHVREALATGEFAAGEYLLGRSSGAGVLPYALPVRDGRGAVLAILTIGVRLDRFGERFAADRLDPGAVLTISDHQGTRLFRHPGNPAEAPEGGPVRPDVLQIVREGQGEELTAVTGLDGLSRLLACRQLSLTPGAAPYLYLFMSVPKATILAPAREALRRDLAVLVLILGLTLALAWFLGGRTVARDLESLAGAVKAFGQGVPLARLRFPDASGEVGVVVGAFTEMIREVEDRSWERDMALRELVKSEEKFRTVADFTCQWEYWRDPAGRLVWVSPSCLEVTGYTAEEFMADPLLVNEVVLPEDRPVFGGHLRAVDLEQVGPCALEFRIRHRCGAVVWVHHQCQAIARGDGEPLGRRASNQDITARKQAEEALRKAKDMAESGSRAKSEFLANMSHEIRTPLNGMLGLLQLLDTRNLTPEYRDLAATALQSGRNLLTLLNDILDLSKIEAGRLDIHEDAYSPRSLAAAACGLFTPLAAEKGLTLLCRVAEDLPDHLLGDVARLRQIIFNLLGNAVKFTETGGVIVEIGRDGTGQRLELAIADTGIGIGPELMGRLFEPFTQGDGSYTRRYPGTGLGLGLVRRVAALLDGTVAVESEPGQGTVVTVSLPLRTASGAGTGAPLPEPEQCPYQARILLVDDDQLNRTAMGRLLSQNGQNVRLAVNGQDALDILRRAEFDAVLMDMQMPVMDGVEATRRIRAGEAGEAARGVTVIALTAHALAGDREACLEAGCDGYLAKPVDIDALMAALGQAVDAPSPGRTG